MKKRLLTMKRDMKMQKQFSWRLEGSQKTEELASISSAVR